MLNIKTFVCNLLQENTYIVNDETRDCIIIDCGAYFEDEQEAIIKYIDKEGLHPVHLITTHGHFDHNLGNDFIYKTYGLKVEVAQEDDFLINDLPRTFYEMLGVHLGRKYPSVGRFFDSGEIIKFGNHELKVLPTPGHSPGSVVFYCEAEKLAFTGDTLFKMSVGRTDFDRGSYTELMNSLKEVIAKLPAETKLYSGHGPVTTLSDELRYNPYLH